MKDILSQQFEVKIPLWVQFLLADTVIGILILCFIRTDEILFTWLCIVPFIFVNVALAIPKVGRERMPILRALIAAFGLCFLAGFGEIDYFAHELGQETLMLAVAFEVVTMIVMGSITALMLIIYGVCLWKAKKRGETIGENHA